MSALRNKVALRLARHGIGPGATFESRIVWIFGSPRSGSTWLLQMLSALPGVVTINEPLIGAYLGEIVCDYRGVRIEDLNVSNFTFERQRRHIPQQFFSEQSRGVWAPLLGKLIKTRFLAHVTGAPDAGAVPLVVVKEPNGSQAADLILAAVPKSRAIFLLRDGRDVVDSELAGLAPDGWLGKEFTGLGAVEPAERLEFVVRSASKWLWRTEVVEDAVSRHPGPGLTVKYEDLLTDTAASFGHVCRFLGVEITDDDLGALVARTAFASLPPELRGAGKFFRAAQPGLWRENLSADEQTAVERVIGPKLRELGYQSS